MGTLTRQESAPVADRRGENPASATLRAAAGGAGAFFSDAGYVYLAPTRISRTGLMWLAAAAGAAGAIYANDQAIMDAIQRSNGNRFYAAAVKPGRQWERVGNMGNTNVYYVAGIVVGHVTGLRPLGEISGEILESHLLAGGLRNLGEVSLGRYRPFENRGPYFFEFNGGTSLPSGHASVVFELATILSHHVRGWPSAARWPATTLLYGAATSMALQRMDSRSHWPSDVFIGAVVGSTVARTVVRRHDERHRQESARMQRER